ncbi:HAMP domain-containing sensor histidine kinase, partial [Chamaesiphon sp. VAR_69_metabat_338]|uniref:sensor histidine kinase n=1 Tax=Chamaesiphon sp. VAR_69_metabat_338 TaxID=2964704 RepID=UPI00286EAED7
MLSPIDSTYLCQLTATQIQEILVLNGVLIQQYQSQLHRWVTIAQLPDLGQLTLSLEPEKAAEIDRRLHQYELVEFTAMTTVMNLNICDRYVFIPLVEQPNLYEGDVRAERHQQSGLWGRICLVGNLHSIWTPQDLSWVQALGQQLLTAMNLLTTTDAVPPVATSSSPLADLAELIEKITDLESRCQQKDRFINEISHDLRAPLMNIKMAMRMLKTSLKTDPHIAELLVGHKAETYLAILEQECDREVELIDNILDIQKLEYAIDGRAEAHALGAASPVAHRLNLESLEIATWLPSTIEPFNYRAQTDRQKLITSVSQLVSTITTDRAYLTKIFTELLNNACKYTREDGEIIVAVDTPDREWLTLVVKNQAEIPDRH